MGYCATRLSPRNADSWCICSFRFRPKHSEGLVSFFLATHGKTAGFSLILTHERAKHMRVEYMGTNCGGRGRGQLPEGGRESSLRHSSIRVT